MQSIDTSQFDKYAKEIVEKLDDISFDFSFWLIGSELTNHDIRRYVEKRMNLEKRALVEYEQQLRNCVNVHSFLNFIM